jgi:hypothetical protein
MLNGIDPIIIFHFYNKGAIDVLSDLPFGAAIADAVGLPIPIYLSESLTGIFVDSESRGIDVETKVDPITEKDPLTLEVLPPVVNQTAVDATTTISLVASRESVILSVLIALCEMVVSRLVTQEYGITYLNGPTAIFNGLLHRFQTNVNRNDTLVRIEFTLSNAKKEQPTPKLSPPPIPNFRGAIPL